MIPERILNDLVIAAIFAAHSIFEIVYHGTDIGRARAEIVREPEESSIFSGSLSPG